MDPKEVENEIFKLITYSGTARADLYEALKETRGNNYNKTEELLKSVDDKLVLAHNVQTKLIQEDLNKKLENSLLLIHAQDQFMTTMSEQSLIEQMIIMQKEINKLI
ncbi:MULTISPECIES: PTS lactose/cellobiose transporter subunit IIA [Lactobacillus]|uniref:PTS lactose/cellobiose transporter subunit IIA n=1 Tax=Lactobacillus TaxID=1578 RepID=UPI001C6976B4|nr:MULTISPECIES: PTS lactose/cellobiose transporter subunit IIA [Lactobacillus]MCX8722042.1 PTS lactose/cellobiose transporter subunit IIA [Lactobacillus sp. B4010]MCX8732680.1 PTS lactose/cellobiose transporter subunit IIA [Lactobacillus sp. B4015]MCX8734900.1 PTS lactose/cellobiose transporter subunit IIA [Lactobacillus sp. B4012]QYN57536.1 PTS lactose/cellobiose transporter subunit IIA [Lactobacillus panisapium]